MNRLECWLGGEKAVDPDRASVADKTAESARYPGHGASPNKGASFPASPIPPTTAFFGLGPDLLMPL